MKHFSNQLVQRKHNSTWCNPSGIMFPLRKISEGSSLQVRVQTSDNNNKKKPVYAERLTNGSLSRDFMFKAGAAAVADAVDAVDGTSLIKGSEGLSVN